MPPARHFAEQMMPSAAALSFSIALRALFQALPRFAIFAASRAERCFSLFFSHDFRH
jgi:hypothetical protein